MFQTIKQIICWISTYRKRLYLGLVCSFLSSIMTGGTTAVASWALGEILQSYWNGTPLPPYLAVKSALLISLFVILRFLFSYWRAVLQESIGHEAGAQKRIVLGDALKRVSLGYFTKNSIGDILASLTTELSAVELQSMKMVDVVLNGYIQLFAIIVCMAFLSPYAALLAVFGTLLSMIALNAITSSGNASVPKSHQAIENLSGAVLEYIRGLPVIKSFGQKGVAIQGLQSACANLKVIQLKIQRGFVPFNCLHLLALKATSIALVVFCAWQTYTEQISLSVFLMFILFSFTMFGSVENINDAAHVLTLVKSAMDKLDELEEEEYIDQYGSEIQITDYTIRFEDVSFGYDSRMILQNLNIVIPECTTTAIVGPSGSGKSTLCHLIARFYDVNTGKITVGGIDVKNFTCDSLLRNMSMVFQNVYLFRDTIKNNIKFGDPGATDEDVFEAAKAARCHDFIIALPNGYDTLVGESGSSLSGGEKQRISIARAILKNAPIIILDEATASIDPENEHLIQEALTALTKGKTIITIAHRLATIEHADQILVIDKGTVVQQGTHQELLNEEGVYKTFIEIRKQIEGWQLV